MSTVVSAFFPEFIVSIFILINIVAYFCLGAHSYKLSKWITLFGIILALMATFYLQIDPEVYFFDSCFLTNIYTVFFRILILLVGFFLILLSKNLLREKRNKAFLYFSVLLSVLLFAMFAVCAVDFICLFACLFLLMMLGSLLLLFDNGANKRLLFSRYMVPNFAFFALFGTGIWVVYKLFSSFRFSEISQSLANNFILINYPQVIFVIVVLAMICFFLFTLGVIPFVSGVGELFTSISAPLCVYFSCIPVMACFASLSRILLLFLDYAVLLKIILAFVSVVTIFISSFSATRTESLKELMAYSMSFHSAIMLLGLCVFSVYSLSSVLFYLLCYIFINIGAWASIILLYDSEKQENLDGLSGLIYRRPYYVIAFTVLLLCLAGVAPTCGFLSKLYIFSAVARSGVIFLPFLIVALLSSVAMLYAYWRVVRVLFKRVDAAVEIDTHILSSKFILYFCAIFGIVVVVFADKLVYLCQLAAYYI